MKVRDEGHVEAKRPITRVIRERKVPVLSLCAELLSRKVLSWQSVGEDDVLAGCTSLNGMTT